MLNEIYMFSCNNGRSGDIVYRPLKGIKERSNVIGEALISILIAIRDAQTREDKVDAMLLELNKHKSSKNLYDCLIWILKTYANKNNLKHVEIIKKHEDIPYINIKDYVNTIGFMKQLFNEV